MANLLGMKISAWLRALVAGSRATLIGASAVLLAAALVGTSLLGDRPSPQKVTRASGDGGGSPKVETTLVDEQEDITPRGDANQPPAPKPFSGKKRASGSAPVAERKSDSTISIASGLPITRETFRANMPPIYLASSLNSDLDCWTEDTKFKDALRVFKADRRGVLKVEATLPQMWSVEITDQDKEYGSDGFYITGWWAQLSDEGARLVIPVEAGKKIGISGCNYGSAQTSIDISYEFDPNRVLESPRNNALGLANIAPGQLAKISEKVPVNFVFLGFDEQQVDVEGFTDKLPKRYQPVARIPNFYGLNHPLGIDYTYRYKTSFTDQGYEDRFFGFLTASGAEAPTTSYQRTYNRENVFKTQMIDKNFVVDATEVEKWLGQNPPRGIDTDENTIFFINWFGRPDFKFHVYSHLGEIEPDVNTDPGTSDSAKVIAWGGTPPDDPETGLGTLSRVWFYDFSAGPDWRTANSAIDDPGVIPPIWEYDDAGARDPDELTIDMAKLARYVGIDLLFTPSPLYPPGQTPPRLPQKVQIDLATYEGIPGFDASSAWLKPEKVRQSYQLLLPLQEISVTSSDLDPSDADFLRCYLGWSVGAGGPGCISDRPYFDWANMYVHHAHNYSAITKEPTSGADYNVLGLLYATPDQSGTYAFADDNYKDGTQSFMHNFMTYADNGYYGMTNIMIHEGGHHFGLSHPHDGYDWEEDVDFAAQMEGWTFAWAGDESNSVMNYMDINNDFSQFDRDNMNRWHTAAYITSTNAIAMKLLKSPRASEVHEALRQADLRVGEAERLVAAHEYLDAAKTSRDGYLIVLAAAEGIGVKIVGSRNGFSLDAPGQKMHDYAPPEYAYADSLRDFSTFEWLKEARRGPR